MPASTLSSALNGDMKADIEPQMEDLTLKVSTSFSPSTSPIATYLSPAHGILGSHLSRTGTVGPVKQLKSLATEVIKVLLLENINKTGRDGLEARGYQVEFLKSSLPEDELIEKIRWGVQKLSLVSQICCLSNCQGRACYWHPVEDEAHGTSSSRGQESARRRMLLYRYQPGRHGVRCQERYRRVQFTLQQLSQCR